MAEFEEAAKKGPTGEGPVGVKIPNVGTLEKGTPADEHGAGKPGVEGADTPGITLGDMTEDAHTV